MPYASQFNNHATSTLIIDDEPDICYLLSAMLKQKQMEVEFVNSLSGAAASLQRSSPNVIFLDNHLPDGFGMDFIEYIKLHNASSKIIMITAHDSFIDVQKAFGEGVDYFISKPFSREIIFKAVDVVLSKDNPEA